MTDTVSEPTFSAEGAAVPQEAAPAAAPGRPAAERHDATRPTVPAPALNGEAPSSPDAAPASREGEAPFDTSPEASAPGDGTASPARAPGGRSGNRRGGRNGRSGGQPSNGPSAQGGGGAPKAQGAGRTPRKVNPLLQRLFELYPALFGARFLPLKLGVFHDLLALHPDDLPRDELKVALGLHARSTRYLEAVAAGAQRHDLNGQPVEDVAPEHVHHAILEVFRRRQGRTAEDLRPHLRQQLMQAIEASGLSRDDYALRMRTQDETLNAVLDEACAALGEQAAKREALRRAYEASGSTVEQFAEMYGMDPAEVSQALA